jgi:hypothetical protein
MRSVTSRRNHCNQANNARHANVACSVATCARPGSDCGSPGGRDQIDAIIGSPASLPPAAAARDRGVPAPVPVMLYSVVRCIPIAENAGDRFDSWMLLGQFPATAPPCAKSTIPHSAPRVCPAAAFPARRAVAESTAVVPTPPTLLVTDFRASSHGEPE